MEKGFWAEWDKDDWVNVCSTQASNCGANHHFHIYGVCPHVTPHRVNAAAEIQFSFFRSPVLTICTSIRLISELKRFPFIYFGPKSTEMRSREMKITSESDLKTCRLRRLGFACCSFSRDCCKWENMLVSFVRVEHCKWFMCRSE